MRGLNVDREYLELLSRIVSLGVGEIVSRNILVSIALKPSSAPVLVIGGRR